MDDKHRQIDSIVGAVVLGTACGIALASYILIPAAVLIGAAAVTVFLCTSKKTVLLGLFLFAMVFGIGRFELSRPDGAPFENMIGERVTLTGFIKDDPAVKENNQSFILKQDGFNVLVSTDKSTEFLYGDEVAVQGTLERPKNFTTDQGTEFDYVSYLYKDDMLYRISFANVEVLSRNNGNRIVSMLLEFKHILEDKFGQLFSQGDSSLLAGIILGTKSSIHPEFRNDLITTGTIHIVALSGYNVSIIARFFQNLFLNLSLNPRGAGLFGGLGIVVFVLMTGLQATAIRAGIMAVVALIAVRVGRIYDAFRALLFAGFAMILWNPKLLIFDVSFQLSFIATLGIIFLTPIFEQKFVRVPKKVFWVVPLRETLAVTLGAQIAVLPLILYKMGIFSVVALPANILILPAIPLAMGFGAMAGFAGLLHDALAYPFAYITHLLLAYVTRLVEFFADIPYAAVYVRQFSLFLCLALYIILIFYVYWAYKKPV